LAGELAAGVLQEMRNVIRAVQAATSGVRENVVTRFAIQR